MTVAIKPELIFNDFNKAKMAIFEREDKDEGARTLRIVLEKLLQKICENNGINLKNEHNKEKKLDTLNNDLYNNKILDQLTFMENKTFLIVGNKASHGEYQEYDLKKVKDFYKHCQKLIDEYIN